MESSEDRNYTFPTDESEGPDRGGEALSDSLSSSNEFISSSPSLGVFPYLTEQSPVMCSYIVPASFFLSSLDVSKAVSKWIDLSSKV